MSTPQGPAQPPDQAPEWGQPPAGGWGGAQGQQQPNPDDERTQRGTPDALDQAKQQHGGPPGPPSPGQGSSPAPSPPPASRPPNRAGASPASSTAASRPPSSGAAT